MALDTYTNLQADIADWLNRQDLIARIPTFITLFETQFNRAMKAREYVTRAPITLGSQFVARPAGCDAIRSLKVQDTGGPVPLEYATPDQIADLRLDNPTGVPRFYAVVGEEIELAPTPDSAYTGEIQYHARLTPLSGAAPVNWLLTEHPDLYLYGSLTQAQVYLQNDDRLPTWIQTYTALLEQFRTHDEQGTYGTGPLRMRARRPYG